MDFLKTTCSLVSAFTLATSANAMIAIDTTYVGDVGNQADGNGNGAVAYGYNVGTYEVTNSQYVSFLNATGGSNDYGVYNSNMTSSVHGGIEQTGVSGSFTYAVKSGMGDRAVNFVSFWDAARFTNWLTTGNTEVGVYNLGGVTNPSNASITRDATAWANGGVAIASGDEWYKAAYYVGGGTNEGYWEYAHQSNTITTANANYDNVVGRITDVGSYAANASYYGTFDQGGNVFEWNDDLVGATERGLLGGSFNLDDGFLAASNTDVGNSPTGETSLYGFRISSLEPVPEPSTYAAIFGGLALAFTVMRRKQRD